ncbi:MAG TPA: biotin--[acetyl-CoA-carboxylase] ligase [Candidatus Binatia bacterium]|jgi:BirA family biotin operon repressor/biotin-[acetyl-CoA-carboxylase] ligase
MPEPKALNPDEIRNGLGSRRLAKKIHYFSEIDSTNRFAFKRAQEGGEEGEVVIAESQTQGKGRMGRNWFSPPSLNLYLSVILKPKLPPASASQLTLMAAVALAETVQSFLATPPSIKWPNDILVGGKKLAGILTESSCETDRVHFVVIGIGVNLNLPAESISEALRERATSLLILTGKPIDRTLFAGQLINDLDRCYGELEDKGFPWIAGRWEGFFDLRNRKVAVEIADQRLSGIARGIDGDGALILEEESGALRKIIAGEVIPIES